MLRVYANGFLHNHDMNATNSTILCQFAKLLPCPSMIAHLRAYDELNLIDGGGRSYEESMRVMYEDPGQLEDRKKRLMSLFETQTQSGDDSRTGGGKDGKKAPIAVRRTRMDSNVFYCNKFTFCRF